jgi:predicted ATP-grasp superfamily ATP-dependent carboligase
VNLHLQNPVFAEDDWPPVVVGGVFQTGVNLMRDLLRKGVRAVGVDYYLDHHGFRSVYGKSYVCPDPDTDGERWVEFMRDLSRRLGARPVFIAAADAFVTALGRYAPALEDCYIVSPEAAALQASLTTKEIQYELAQRHGFPCPRMAYIRSRAELGDFVRDARFPCLIKPRSQREWDALPRGNPLNGKKIAMADTPEELLNHYSCAEAYRPEAVAQEVIQGPGSAKEYFVGVLGNGGADLGSCVLKAVRDHPPFTGMPSVVRPIVDDEVIALCGGLLRTLGYRGICEFEMKRDVRDGLLRLIEINPRFSGTGDCASYAGVGTGWIHYLDMIGRAVKPVRPTRFDFHHIALKLDAAESSKFVLSGDLKWRDSLMPYRGSREFFDLDFADSRLALETLVLTARYVAGSLLRHWKLRS